MSKVQVGDRYVDGGQRWVVTDTSADIITLSSGNGKRPDRILYPSELEKDYKKLE